MAEQIVAIENLYKIFGKTPSSIMPLVREGVSKDEILSRTDHAVGLRDINLKVEKGEIFVIMGLSGSGKSTLIRHLNRLIEPTEGQIHVDGVDVMGLNPEQLTEFRRHAMSMVFQRFGLMPHRKVLENIAYGLEVQKIERAKREEKAREWLSTVGLEGYEDQYPAQLSGGQQQRVGLARALCTDPKILLMDEAFSALDPLIRSGMQDQLIELNDKLHKTVIFITHDLDEALRLGDHIAILKDGELSQVGRPEEILLHPADDYVEAFVRDVNRARVLTVEVVMKKPVLRIATSNLDEALRQMRGSSHDHGYVFHNDSYMGVVSQKVLEDAVSNPKITGDLHEIAADAPMVGCDTVLQDALPATLDCDYPLPVIDDDGELQGTVSSEEMISALAEPASESSDQEARRG